MTVIVLARIELNPGCRDAFLLEFAQLMPSVHAEEGCIEYAPAIDLPSPLPRQALLGEDVVMIVEKWSTLPALQAHLVAPHMTPYRERVKDLVRDTQLTLLQFAPA